MPSNTLGEAFVLIGGDNSGLKRSVDESLSFVTRSIQSFATISSRFSENFNKSMTGAVTAITGGGGISGAIAGLIDLFTNLERAVNRMSFALQKGGVTSFKARQNIINEVQELRLGTNFTKAAFTSAGAVLAEHLTGDEVLRAARALVGAADSLGTNDLVGAAGVLGKALQQGQGGAFGVGTNPNRTVQENNDRILAILGARDAKVRAQLQDPSLSGGTVGLARAADAINEVLSRVGKQLFGGFTQQQRDNIASAELTKRTGVGPSGRARGIDQSGLLRGSAVGLNALEVAKAFGFKTPTPGKGILSEFTDTLAAFIPTGKELDDVVKSLVSSGREFAAFLTDAPEIMKQALTDVITGQSAGPVKSVLDGFGFDVSPVGPLKIGKLPPAVPPGFDLGSPGTTIASGEMRDAVAEGVRMAMLDMGGGPGIRPVLA